mgnify:FL=1
MLSYCAHHNTELTSVYNILTTWDFCTAVIGWVARDLERDLDLEAALFFWGDEDLGLRAGDLLTARVRDLDRALDGDLGGLPGDFFTGLGGDPGW